MILGDVSQAVQDVVHGPERIGRVAAVTRHAVYIATGLDGFPAIAVLTPEAIRVPNSVVLHPDTAEGTPDGMRWPGVRPSGTARFGAGRLTFGHCRVTATETAWEPPRVDGLLRDGPRPARLAELERTLAGRPVSPSCAPHLAGLRDALDRDDTAAAFRAARALLGRGPGLTPSGDDILCGALLACGALGRPAGVLADVVHGAVERTPLVSAALLLHAARGECVPQAAEVLRGLAGPAPLALRPLLAVGHHSGTDLARGIAMGLRAYAPARGLRGTAADGSGPSPGPHPRSGFTQRRQWSSRR